jgi:hypothetical protein
MVVLEPWAVWVDRVAVHFLEVRGDRMVDLAEALAAGRRFRCSSLTESYQTLIATPLMSVYMKWLLLAVDERCSFRDRPTAPQDQ